MARCRLCRNQGQRTPAEIYLPAHRLPLCREHFLSWFERYLDRTIRSFKMFTRGQRILVAVSGGKDSLSLWQALTSLGYEADGVFIYLGIEENSFSLLSRRAAEAMAERLGRPLHIIDMPRELGFSVPDLRRKTRKTCSLCGTVKRQYLNQIAKRLGYEVIVTGHNLDDEASSLLGNLLNWNLKYLARKYPVLPAERGFVRKAKPLCRHSVREIRLYAEIRKLPYLAESCPLSEEATRPFYAQLLDELEEKAPGTKLRFYLDYLRKAYPLFAGHREEFMDRELITCERCGEPAVSSPCLLCRLKEEYGARA
ncbi:adenine nucleotide alpha hydrolase family protein [Thermosulfurimonas marina]|uniref:Adenine nucleotide alpha hydrolase family protein n=1 Tax=Thermosulfurimonas marina TaxID=2047767 RepID=A0A6H1WT29_9BACT|nr:ATP-binding protein [Thermosulfurimonas marina]QJA06309.1 adenine nucleotide alpha hydrolase family protein [Thermosulfurimonas marina]